MKISFSTLGCPGWSWKDMLATARDIGFDGIEIRGIGNELYAPKALPFNDSNIAYTNEKLQGLRLEIPCLTSSCYLFDKEHIGRYLDEGKDYIDLAVKTGTPFVRVLGDGAPGPKGKVDVDFVAENLLTLADYAKGRGVRILVESNGFFADSDQMAGLLGKTDSPDIGVLWDIHHPYRFFDEPVQKTYETLGQHIMFVHLKDSCVEDGGIRYKMIGYGDVPVKEALLLLKEGGYEGYLSLEWVKRWCMDLEEPGIVFSHFINWVKSAVAL